MGALFLACVAYLLGSFPSGLVLGRLTTGRDVRGYGSGNIGAANVARFAGFRVGVIVGLIDIVKGLLPVLLALWTGLDQTGLALVAAAAVLGHDFSLFLRFRGGKGVATTFGAMLALAPVGTVLAMVGWLGVFGIWGYSSLASLLALAALPILTGFSGRPPVYVVLTTTLFLLATVKHRANIVRLMRGVEPGRGKTMPADGS